MTHLARGYLYFVTIVLVLVGCTGLLAPELLGGQLKVMPTATAGFSEMRGLMGGGFLAFGLCLLIGLRGSPLALGLLCAVALIMLTIAIGRILSLVLDGFDLNAVAATVSELLVTASCWHLMRGLGQAR